MSGQPEPSEPAGHQTTGTHGPDGRFIRTAEGAERDAEALRLRSRRMSYRAIAAEMGYASQNGAYEAVQRALRATVEEPAAEVRQLELDGLDRMQAAVLEVLERRHVTVSNGKIVRVGRPVVNEDGKAEIQEGHGEPVLDDAPVLAAVDRLIKIQERRARLLGLDAETKVSLSGGVTYEVVGVDPDSLV